MFYSGLGLLKAMDQNGKTPFDFDMSSQMKQIIEEAQQTVVQKTTGNEYYYNYYRSSTFHGATIMLITESTSCISFNCP